MTAAAADLAAPLARVGSAWYFDRATLAAGRAVGLDGLRFYFLGRGGVLGAVDWRVVHSGFGYFHPALIERMWTTALERCPRERAVAAHLEAAAAYGRARFEGLDGLEGFCDAAAAVVEATSGDFGGLPLYAGYAAQPLPGDLPGRAIRLAVLLRELRGSVHLAAVRSVGLSTGIAHAIRRPDDMESFGWSEGMLAAPTADDGARLGEADRLTEAAMDRLIEAVDGEGRSALAAGAHAMAGRLG